MSTKDEIDHVASSKPTDLYEDPLNVHQQQQQQLSHQQDTKATGESAATANQINNVQGKKQDAVVASPTFQLGETESEDDYFEDELKIAPISKPKTWVKFEDEGKRLDSSKPVEENGDLKNKMETGVVAALSPPPPDQRQRTPSPANISPTIQAPSVPARTNKVPTAAVLPTESVHIAFKPTTSPTSMLPNEQSNPAVIDIPITSSVSVTTNSNPGLRTIELSSGRVREGFANGDIIVTLLPVNTKWPWITPAVFRPELVPEELMAQGLTLTVEEYVHAMETLVNDYRFTLYNICYKRVLCCWIIFAFSVLLGLLFSGLVGIALFSLGVGWLFLNAAAIFFCMWIKLRLSRGLERCMASVNKQLLRHKIILVLDDRGRISCHKVNLCFMYYEPVQCVNYLNEFIERNEQNGTAIEPGWESRLDVAANDIVIQGSNTTRVSRKQERGTLLFLRYASRWGNEVIRGIADVSIIEPARHCAAFVCPCQYIERHISCKPRGKSKYFKFNYWVKASERYD